MAKLIPAKEPELLCQIEYYLDSNPEHPEAWKRFLRRMGTFHLEYDRWATVVSDSSSSMELCARMNQRFNVNKGAKDPRQWWGGSTDDLEMLLQIRFGALPMNVIACSHVDEDKDEMHGTFVRSAKLPGRLKKGTSTTFSEIYHASVRRNAEGIREYIVQTGADNLWNAASQIDAPEYAFNDYEALWETWDAANPGVVRPIIHCHVYGDAGAGKSAFAATFPKPIVVFMFDAFGKETPYKKIGNVVDCEADENGTPIVQVWSK